MRLESPVTWVGRRREMGTMRRVILMALLGAFTGIALGVVSGLALSRALADEGITTVAVPTGTLAVYLVIATAVGVLASIGPARRASRVDVLRAIAAE